MKPIYPPITEATPLTPWGELANAEPCRTFEEALRQRWAHVARGCNNSLSAKVLTFPHSARY
jgi:hypothetical protein